MSDRNRDDHQGHPEFSTAQLSLREEPGWALGVRGSSPAPPVAEKEHIVSGHLYGSDVSGVWPPSP